MHTYRSLSTADYLGTLFIDDIMRYNTLIKHSYDYLKRFSRLLVEYHQDMFAAKNYTEEETVIEEVGESQPRAPLYLIPVLPYRVVLKWKK